MKNENLFELASQSIIKNDTSLWIDEEDTRPEVQEAVDVLRDRAADLLDRWFDYARSKKSRQYEIVVKPDGYVYEKFGGKKGIVSDEARVYGERRTDPMLNNFGPPVLETRRWLYADIPAPQIFHKFGTDRTIAMKQILLGTLDTRSLLENGEWGPEARADGIDILTGLFVDPRRDEKTRRYFKDYKDPFSLVRPISLERLSCEPHQMVFCDTNNSIFDAFDIGSLPPAVEYLDPLELVDNLQAGLDEFGSLLLSIQP